MRSSILRDRKGVSQQIADVIREHSMELNETSLNALLDAIGDCRYVLLGEASHGTHEYYTWRTQISRRLIQEKHFSFIAVEGDWPDCYRLNRYTKGYKDPYQSAKDVLHEFNRWPTWMWANWEIVALTEWMRTYNGSLPLDKRVGFYGLDVYSLWESLEAIIQYLDKVDPKAKEIAMEAWKCFEPYSEDEGQSYARATRDAWVPASCEREVIELLLNIRQKVQHYDHDPEAALSTEQNALIAVHAERYYRAMIQGGPDSWNIRDHHMVDTIERLMRHHGPAAKAIVWEHNTHIGDARYTDMHAEGMVNVGQLVRERHANDGVFAVGFGSYRGSVIAGRHWGDPMQRMVVPEAQEGSWEYMLHAAGGNRLMIMDDTLKESISQEIGHRAIGVVYNPKWEFGNYVPSVVPRRYDAFVFIDETKGLHPLHIRPNGHEMPETYPFGV